VSRCVREAFLLCEGDGNRIGRTTIDVLQINRPAIIALRGILMTAGLF
jgi:hypothetical protein